ncbi:hypothetical protein O181_038280 [Austropuccinia psidii MF-1]|uniref:PWI domain-containing protein n=1 Tax=Austropuccinia psidii MF-1 TaxID=1389203 RepID=A0A9Q3HE00_9BASI|nr:hypothetical protein [Austropuccinia psidii MF-1]
MGDAGFFKGTSSEQDTRFKDKEKSLLKSINFPKELDQKVDMRKVELSVMRPWIAEKIMELLGFEDEVVVEYVNGLLEDQANPIVDPKRMQINLTGFLESKTGQFMSELWALLISAQQSPLKVPALFIEQKKEEMRKREQADFEAQALIKQRQEQEEERERKLAEIRRRERANGNKGSRAADSTSDPSHNNGTRYGNGGGGGHPPRGNFVPPRSRDSGWGNRSGASRLYDNGPRSRDDFSSNSRRERSRSPGYSRRDAHAHRDHPSSHRHPRSFSRSRSRSRTPPVSRRSHRRASPFSPPARRALDSSKAHRRSLVYRGSHRNPDGRSSSSGSPQRSSYRRRSISRSTSPPRRRVSDLSLGHDHDSHSRHRQRDHTTRDRRRHRATSHSRSPPRKRTREESGKSHRGVDAHSRRSGTTRERSRSPVARQRNEIQFQERQSSKRERSLSARSRSPPSPLSIAESMPSMQPKAVNSNEDAEKKKQPPVISIKGRASKSNVQKSEQIISHELNIETGKCSDQPNGHLDKGQVPLANEAEAVRPQVSTELIKERLLREKVKASMNHHK